MSINVKELTKNKSMKMSDEDVAKTVSRYMMKVALEQLEWTVKALTQLSSTLKYRSEKVEKEDIDPNLSPESDTRQYCKDYSTSEISYGFNFKSIDHSSGDLAA